MLGLKLEETRIYREAKEEGKEEGKLAAVPVLLKAGISVEKIAEELGLEVEQIKQIAQQQP